MNALRLLLLTLVASTIAPAYAQDSTVLPGFGSSQFRFATVAQGAAQLTRRDAFWDALSPFDRQSRLQVAQDPGTEALVTHVARQVLAWEENDVAKVRQAIDRLRPRLQSFPLPWPEEILLIHTTGRDEGDAAYCRGAAIVLPRAVLAREPDSLERLLAHELFHVLSNQNPELRRRWYRIIGCEVCPPIRLPDRLAARKITNPDAPLLDCVMTLASDNGPLTVTPVLLASVERYDPTKGGSFFRYLTFRLLVVESSPSGEWRAALRNDEAQLLDPQQTPAYFELIGRNTKYIIHADEILADNFMLLLFPPQQPATPRILEQLRSALTR